MGEPALEVRSLTKRSGSLVTVDDLSFLSLIGWLIVVEPLAGIWTTVRRDVR